jgi:ABC-type branched-subunit amino acid transport system ATPase component
MFGGQRNVTSGEREGTGEAALGGDLPVLVADAVTVQFGGLRALSEVSLEATSGEVTGLIGPNGAGKTTFFNVLSGLVAPTSGRVWLGRDELFRLPPWERARRGLGRTYQTPKLMPARSALENVEVGLFATERSNPLADLVRWPGLDSARRRSRAHARDVLARVDGTVAPTAPVATLTLAQRRAVEIARALCSSPRLLLLDEPFGGFHVEERERMAELIQSLCEDGLSMLLIEHDMAMVGRLCTAVYVLNFGQLLAAGTPREVAGNPAVVQAYLGEDSAVA